MKIGFTLPNRGVLLGITTPVEMLELAEIADQSGQFASVWVGDSLLGKPRMEALTLLAALAARTRHVRLGAACLASFPLRDPVLLAYQWASLDMLAEGRSVLVACTGIVPQEGARIEGALYGLEAKDRVGRLIEWITLIRRLWTEDQISYAGKHYRCEDVTIEPKPVASPHPPIWIASNAVGERALVERTLRRVVAHTDGWQTSLSEPEELKWRLAYLREQAVATGRNPTSIETNLYHNINVNDDQPAALAESQQFLEEYYAPVRYSMEAVNRWVATGSPEQCAEHLRIYQELGFDEVTLRLTSWDQLGQLQRVREEVLPLLTA